MKKIILAVVVFLSALSISCGSDDERISPTFRFLEFEKDVLLPAINEREITFLAIDFDENIGNWELILSDGQQNNPVTLSEVETTGHGWTGTESRLQRIYVKTPALGEGDYLLQIKNKTSGQIHSEKFLIRSGVFNEISQEHPNVSYTIISSYSEGETKPIIDYMYFQNISSTITADITKNGIQKIMLDNKDSSGSFVLDHEISANNEIIFTIPETVPVGSYFLSVHYDNGLSSYFEKDIIVLEKQIPVVESVNKETFSEGETLILKGKDFRYDIKPGILPSDGLSNTKTTSFLVFRDNQNEYSLSFGAYAEYDERYEDINTEATELTYTIPSRSNAFFYIENGKNYFEGEVFVRNGPYDSNPMPIRIEY